MSSRKHIDFVYFDAGGGHRSAATALKSVIEESGQYPWDVQLVNLQEVLDSLDIFRKITGIRMEDVYNLLLKKGWTLGSSQLMMLMHGIIRLYHPAQVRLLKEFWRKDRPDLVVSLVPNFNRAMFQSLTAALPGTPYVTVLTDFADYPPHFWMERQDQFLICGTAKAATQARTMGYPAARVFRTSGMILRPSFYEPVTGDRAEGRRTLGLDPDVPTALVLFGGQGSSVMIEIARRLGNSDAAVQLILVCGRNERLAGKLRVLKTKNRLSVLGFTKEIPNYMHLSDFLIGKPGPGSISEALAMKLPVIVERNAWTLPQERYNAEWVWEQQVGLVLPNFRGIEAAVKEMLEEGKLAKYRENAARVENRAVFEIPEILERVLGGAGG